MAGQAPECVCVAEPHHRGTSIHAQQCTRLPCRRQLSRGTANPCPLPSQKTEARCRELQAAGIRVRLLMVGTRGAAVLSRSQDFKGCIAGEGAGCFWKGGNGAPWAVGCGRSNGRASERAAMQGQVRDARPASVHAAAAIRSGRRPACDPPPAPGPQGCSPCRRSPRPRTLRWLPTRCLPALSAGMSTAWRSSSPSLSR